MQESVDVKLGDVVFTAECDGVVAEAIVSRLTEEGYFADLTVKKGGEVLWTSGYVSDPSETFAFGVWFEGQGLPVLWHDVDNDSKTELVAPSPKGDISPTVFRIFRWTGDELVFVKRRCLILESEGSYRWTSWDDIPDECVWIDSVDRAGKAEWVGLGNSGEIKRDTVDLDFVKDGFKVKA